MLRILRIDRQLYFVIIKFDTQPYLDVRLRGRRVGCLSLKKKITKFIKIGRFPSVSPPHTWFNHVGCANFSRTIMGVTKRPPLSACVHSGRQTKLKLQFIDHLNFMYTAVVASGPQGRRLNLGAAQGYTGAPLQPWYRRSRPAPAAGTDAPSTGCCYRKCYSRVPIYRLNLKNGV